MGISLFRAIANQYRDLRRVNSVAMMNAISHLIEEQVIAHRLPVDFYAGFQRFSNFASQQRRYERLGAACRRVYVFGVPDIRPPAIQGVQFVELPVGEPLAREWFLVVDTPEFWTALLTQEAPDGRDVGGGRRYDGVWSYDTQVVERASLLLSQALDTAYEPVGRRDSERQGTHIAEMSAKLLARLELTRVQSQRRWVHLCTLQKVAEALAKNRRTTNLAWDTVQILRIIFGADDATIALATRERRFVVAAAHSHGAQERELQLEQGASGEAYRQGRTVSLTDMRRSRALDPLIPGAQSLVAAPITGRRRVYGVIAVGSEQAGRWTAEDAQTITALAALLAGVFDQRAEALDDAELRLEKMRQVEAALARLREAAGQMAELRRELDLIGGSGLTPTQRIAVDRADSLADQLARSIGVADANGGGPVMRERSMGE
ncbi:MAG: hypothetical protein RLZZ387_1300 [Chloroflexota bacterium]